jgi:sigma-B regulation protein RsbU (phosphoserine phosphatase)
VPKSLQLRHADNPVVLGSTESPRARRSAALPEQTMNETNRYLRILVVDDSAVSRKLAEITFHQKPYELFIADSAEQALKLFEAHRPDVVITDWVMPGLSGPELCQIIRNKLNARDTYLILMTSNSHADYIAQGLAAGADAYLLKPLRTNDLLAQLSAARAILKSRRHPEPAKTLA